ncbi:hypothetical protein NPIL_373241 [Nephila pilipes]|uniref:Uncharacterized protein n=1 Tax=Nephila pilipes TaxID=299642 RepID=A0A8X6UD61_NEPPI|nr:hypothetical protein NPIL_373241 [Nephila pilipes]
MSLSIGRSERSEDQETSFLARPGMPNDPLLDVHFLPYFDNGTETNVTFQESKTAHLHCRIHQIGNKEEQKQLSSKRVTYSTKKESRFNDLSKKEYKIKVSKARRRLHLWGKISEH